MSSTERFTSRADAYAASRPWYPTAAIDAILAGFDPATLVVADLGAGTGISSRAIAGRGPRVLAIEPNAAMRGTAQPDPRIVWIDATAETTTLAEHSVDLAVAFQAWHWFDQAAVTAEVRRIARPGGRLAVAYNERSERDPFTAAYGAVVRRYATDETEQRRASALRSALGIDRAPRRRPCTPRSTRYLTVSPQPARSRWAWSPPSFASSFDAARGQRCAIFTGSAQPLSLLIFD